MTPAAGRGHRLALGELPAGGLKVELQKVRWTGESFAVHAFLNLPDERLASADMGDPHYADSFYMYGSGDAPGSRVRELHLTGVLRVGPELIREHGRPRDNELTLVVEDLAGERADASLLQFAAYTVEPISRR